MRDIPDEITDFCALHASRRNLELHTGELAFEALGTSQWLPKFYLASKVLLESIGRDLSDVFSDPSAAQAMIDSLQDEAAKAVDKDIKAHAQVWKNKSSEQRSAASAQAVAWATRHVGHRVECPACKSPALLQGSASGTVATTIGNDVVTQRQTMLPTSFECIACGLRIAGLSKLTACGLGDAFTAKSTYSAAEFFGLYTEEELEEARNEHSHFEEDFNEY